MNSIHCFAIKRGDLERRLNSDFYHPERLTTIIALKDRWRANELRKISEVIIEHNEQYNISIEDEYLGLANIKAGLGIVDWNASEEASGKCKRFEKNWILYGKLRPYLNKVLLTSKSGQCSTEFYTLSIRDEHTIRIDFLHSFLCSQLLLNQSVHLMTGNTHPRILWEDFQEILIPIPSVEQQINLSQAIVNARNNYISKSEQAEELLKGLDEYILEKLDITKPTEERIKIFSRKRSETLNSRIDPHFHSPYFLKVFDAINKSKFVKQPLSNLLEDIAGGATPKKGDADLYDSSGIKFLRILNVKPNFIDLDDVKYIQSHVHNGELLRSQLQTNDVVMTITGRVGTASTIEEEILPANINQHLVRLRIKDQKCLPKYLSAYLNTSVGNAMTNKGVSGGTRIAVDYKWVGSLPIPLPPKEIQQEIINEVNRRKEKANKLRAEAETEWQNAKKWFEEQLLEGAK